MSLAIDKAYSVLPRRVLHDRLHEALADYGEVFQRRSGRMK